MKYQLRGFVFFIAVLIFLSILFGIWFYYYYALENIKETPLKEAISLSLTFLGSCGTLASILFAFYLYIKQQEKNNEDEKTMILNGKPTFFIRIDDIYESSDNNSQPALAIDFNIKIYNSNASSFSFQFDYLPDKKEQILVDFDYQHGRNDIFKAGENLNITAIFTSSKSVVKPPKKEELNIYLKAVYLDKLNNSIEDYFLLKHPLSNAIPFVKSNIMTPSRKFIK